MATNSTYDGRSCGRILPVHIDASTAYAAGDVVGNNGPFKLANFFQRAGYPAKVQKVGVNVKGTNKPQITLIIFNRQPSSAMTDNAAYAPSDVDVAAIVDFVEVVASDYKTLGSTKTTAVVSGSQSLIDAPEDGSRDAWVVIQADAAFTPATLQEMVIRVYGDV